MKSAIADKISYSILPGELTTSEDNEPRKIYFRKILRVKYLIGMASCLKFFIGTQGFIEIVSAASGSRITAFSPYNYIPTALFSLLISKFYIDSAEESCAMWLLTFRVVDNKTLSEIVECPDYSDEQVNYSVLLGSCLLGAVICSFSQYGMIASTPPAWASSAISSPSNVAISILVGGANGIVFGPKSYDAIVGLINTVKVMRDPRKLLLNVFILATSGISCASTFFGAYRFLSMFSSNKFLLSILSGASTVPFVGLTLKAQLKFIEPYFVSQKEVQKNNISSPPSTFMVLGFILSLLLASQNAYFTYISFDNLGLAVVFSIITVAVIAITKAKSMASTVPWYRDIMRSVYSCPKPPCLFQASAALRSGPVADALLLSLNSDMPGPSRV